MSEEFETVVEVTRGTGTNDRDKFKTTVSAPDIHTLTERVEELREEMEEWAEEFRCIQPEESVRNLTENQSTLGKGEA